MSLISTNTLSLTTTELWGIPKPQFVTIKPVQTRETIRGQVDKTYTGQIDILSAEEEMNLTETREKARIAFSKAHLERFPEVDNETAAQVMAASEKSEELAKTRVWSSRTTDEQQRVESARHGADEIDALIDPEMRKLDYLKRKAEYRKRKEQMTPISKGQSELAMRRKKIPSPLRLDCV